ncbi:7700_t:CDS:1, partial [Dentiscutata erythropus]
TKINQTNTEGNTPMMCKVQVVRWKVEIILNSSLSISIVCKNFLESLGQRIEKLSNRRIIDIYGEKYSSLEILIQ